MKAAGVQPASRLHNVNVCMDPKTRSVNEPDCSRRPGEYTMPYERPSEQSRNQAHIRKHSAEAEQYLTQVEKVSGAAKAWQLREQLESGQKTLRELKGS